MRKNRFLLNLIAATAIGLSVFGCESSSSGAIQSTADINEANAAIAAEARANTREYIIVAQRGLEPGAFTPGATQSVPASAPAGVVTESRDGVLDSGRAQLYELFGINALPERQPNFSTPGDGASRAPNVPDVSADAGNLGTTGYHNVYVDPTQKFVIGMSRARNRGGAGDLASPKAQMQIFQLDYARPTDEVFPPSVVFGPVQDVTPIVLFDPDQGEFVSGAWSPDALHFYAAIENYIITYKVNQTTGRLLRDRADSDTLVAFPASAAGKNNAVQLLPTKDGRFIFALDNANNQIVRFSRDATTGLLTKLSEVPTVTDPRGASIDRSENFLYVAGRSSGTLAGYRITESGDLEPIALDPNFGPIPLNFSQALADVDCNPLRDALYLGSYAGELRAFSINPETGAIFNPGTPEPLLGGNSRNMANVEVDATGEFVLTVQEHDFENFQSYVAAENPIFANIDSSSNGGTESFHIYSLTPQRDQGGAGKIAYAPPTAESDAFQGGVQLFRIEADNGLRAERQIDADNPYGLDFFQRVVAPLPEESETAPNP